MSLIKLIYQYHCMKKVNKSVELQHDRILLTNYYFIYRGAGFNVFDADKEIKDHSEMNFKFIFTQKLRSLFNKKKDIQKLINLVESNSPSLLLTT